MNDKSGDVRLIACCGLYCGECGAFLKEHCGGCSKNSKAKWCKVRSCCVEHACGSCAECTEFDDPAKCSKFNSWISRLFGLIFRSDRRACIMRIREVGPQQFADEMAAAGRHGIRRQ